MGPVCRRKLGFDGPSTGSPLHMGEAMPDLKKENKLLTHLNSLLADSYYIDTNHSGEVRITPVNKAILGKS